MKRHAAIFIAAIGIFSISGDLQARQTAGSMGRHAVNADKDCFVASYQSIRQTCAPKKQWVPHMPVDGVGYYSPRYRVSAPAIGYIACQTFSMAPNQTFTSTPYTNNTVTGLSVLSPGTVYVPTEGILHAGCDMWGGTQLFNTVF